MGEKQLVFLPLLLYYMDHFLKEAGGCRQLSVYCGLMPQFQTRHGLYQDPVGKTTERAIALDVTERTSYLNFTLSR